MAKRKPKLSTKILSNKIERALLYITNPRAKKVIERRFGLKTGKPETLEAIGKNYGVTRERVRQIQDVGLGILKSNDVISLFEPVFKEVNDLFAEHGHLMGEEYLYYTATGTDQAHPLRGHLYLVLTLGEPYQRIINDSRFNTYWIADKLARTRAEKLVDFLINYFNKHNQVFPEPDIINVLSKNYSNVPAGMFCSVLNIAKDINKNVFGEMGLSHWSEISPQGVKDRAHLVLKRKGEPLHFVNITELINQSFVDRSAYVQTVHNELIKDPRFVLVGRGTYALAEWGHKPGTVGDVIERILKDSKEPMTKKEILDAVLAERLVRPTTVVLNLQRSSRAKQLEDGRFVLA